ncbi:MAG: hypothetical protein GY835_00365 [bacterium]|nr:hypothetical protein [bacterium]
MGISTYAYAQDVDSSSTDADANQTGEMVSGVLIDDSGIVLYDEEESDFESGEHSFEREIRPFTAYDDYDDESVIFGRDVIVDEDQSVQKDMVIVGGDLEIYGEVVGEIVVILGDVYLFDGSSVTGDILSIGGEVDISAGAEIIGEVTPISTNVWGLFNDDWDWDWYDVGFHPIFSPFNRGNMFSQLLRTLLLAWIGMFLLAKRIPNLSKAFRHRPWFSMLVGLLTVGSSIVLLIPAAILIALLVLVLIGIPVAILGIIAIVGLMIIAWLVPIYTFSRFTFEAHGMHRFLSVSLWVVFFWMLAYMAQLHGIFGFVRILLTLTGLGAVVLSRIGSRDVTSQ